MRNYSAPTQFIVNKGPLDILDNSEIFDQLSNQEFHLESLAIMNPANCTQPQCSFNNY